MGRGALGAGTGATTGKIGGTPDPGGVGLGVVGWPGAAVAAIVATNALGDVVDPATGRRVAGPVTEPADRRASLLGATPPGATPGTNTTLVAVVVAAPADHDALARCAVAAHDGLARAIRPCHTLFDGDTVFVAALVEGMPSPESGLALAMGTELAVERAVVNAVAPATAGRLADR